MDTGRQKNILLVLVHRANYINICLTIDNIISIRTDDFTFSFSRHFTIVYQMVTWPSLSIPWFLKLLKIALKKRFESGTIVHYPWLPMAYKYTITHLRHHRFPARWPVRIYTGINAFSLFFIQKVPRLTS